MMWILTWKPAEWSGCSKLIMFVFLSKFMPILVYPLGLACVFLVVALLAGRKTRLWRAAVIVALTLLWVGGNRWVAASLTRGLEWQYLAADDIPHGRVIVLLGGGTSPQEAPRPMVELNAAGDRVLYAAWLYQQRKAEHILVSGGNITWTGNHRSTPADDMVTLLGMMGVPSNAIWIQNRSQNTREDVEYSRVMLAEKGIDEIILVTSAMHMPRSVGLFEKQGFKVIPAPVDFKVTEQYWQNIWHGSFQSMVIGLLPGVDNLSVTSAALKEYIGILVYGLMGWL